MKRQASFKRRLRGVALVLVSMASTHSLAAVLASSSACPSLDGAGVRQLRQGAVLLAWKSVPYPIPVSQPFELELVLCGDTASLVRVDADMPAHRHGMNYRPSITPVDPQRSRVQGLLFHMPGQWRLSFDVLRGKDRIRLTDTVQLP